MLLNWSVVWSCLWQTSIALFVVKTHRDMIRFWSPSLSSAWLVISSSERALSVSLVFHPLLLVDDSSSFSVLERELIVWSSFSKSAEETDIYLVLLWPLSPFPDTKTFNLSWRRKDTKRGTETSEGSVCFIVKQEIHNQTVQETNFSCFLLSNMTSFVRLFFARIDDTRIVF